MMMKRRNKKICLQLTRKHIYKYDEIFVFLIFDFHQGNSYLYVKSNSLSPTCLLRYCNLFNFNGGQQMELLISLSDNWKHDQQPNSLSGQTSSFGVAFHLFKWKLNQIHLSINQTNEDTTTRLHHSKIIWFNWKLCLNFSYFEIWIPNLHNKLFWTGMWVKSSINIV